MENLSAGAPHDWENDGVGGESPRLEDATDGAGDVNAESTTRRVEEPKHPLAPAWTEVYHKYGEEHYPESTIPDTFTLRDENGHLCRYITHFLVYNRRGERIQSIEGLDAAKLKWNLVLYGHLLSVYSMRKGPENPSLKTKKAKMSVLNTGPNAPYPIRVELTKWQIEFGPYPFDKPSIWLISTTNAFYRLEKPAGRYRSTFQTLKGKCDIAARVLKTLQLNPLTPLQDIVCLICFGTRNAQKAAAIAPLMREAARVAREGLKDEQNRLHAMLRELLKDEELTPWGNLYRVSPHIEPFNFYSLSQFIMNQAHFFGQTLGIDLLTTPALTELAHGGPKMSQYSPQMMVAPQRSHYVDPAAMERMRLAKFHQENQQKLAAGSVDMGYRSPPEYAGMSPYHDPRGYETPQLREELSPHGHENMTPLSPPSPPKKSRIDTTEKKPSAEIHSTSLYGARPEEAENFYHSWSPQMHAQPSPQLEAHSDKDSRPRDNSNDYGSGDYASNGDYGPNGDYASDDIPLPGLEGLGSDGFGGFYGHEQPTVGFAHEEAPPKISVSLAHDQPEPAFQPMASPRPMDHPHMGMEHPGMGGEHARMMEHGRLSEHSHMNERRHMVEQPPPEYPRVWMRTSLHVFDPKPFPDFYNWPLSERKKKPFFVGVDWLWDPSVQTGVLIDGVNMPLPDERTIILPDRPTDLD